MFNFLAVFIGGGIGASLRHMFSSFSREQFGINCRATFIINVLGSLFLAFISTLAIKDSALITPIMKLFLTTGIAGGFTTFSTFGNENINLLREGRYFTSIFYLSSSLIFSLAAVYLGYKLAILI